MGNESKMKRFIVLMSIVLLTLALPLSRRSAGQSAAEHSKTFMLSNFDEVNHTCRAKGRLQDQEYCKSKMMDQIIARGKDAIPILISQITDSHQVKQPIYDYWNRMAVGDVAYFVLTDLFTDSDWKSFNMPGLNQLSNGCRNTSEECWNALVQKRGRRFIQSQWLAAWNANKDKVYWDVQAHCFRISRNAAPNK